MMIPTSNDILLGRGRLPQTHNGNFLFRRIILTKFIPMYYDETIPRGRKSKILGMAVDHFRSMGMRFLKHDAALDDWIECSNREAKMKVGHVIRDNKQQVLEQLRAARMEKQEQEEKEVKAQFSISCSPHGQMMQGTTELPSQTTESTRKPELRVLRAPVSSDLNVCCAKCSGREDREKKDRKNLILEENKKMPPLRRFGPVNNIPGNGRTPDGSNRHCYSNKFNYSNEELAVLPTISPPPQDVHSEGERKPELIPGGYSVNDAANVANTIMTISPAVSRPHSHGSMMKAEINSEYDQEPLIDALLYHQFALAPLQEYPTPSSFPPPPMIGEGHYTQRQQYHHYNQSGPTPPTATSNPFRLTPIPTLQELVAEGAATINPESVFLRQCEQNQVQGDGTGCNPVGAVAVPGGHETKEGDDELLDTILEYLELAFDEL